MIIFIIYYLGRLFTRYILPSLFYNYMDDKMKEFSEQQKNNAGVSSSRRGNVRERLI
ncbi:MAG: hypothetical protein MZV63_13130 [Marinilabiliales bacterium]|nr:hypothetical protein [Marinilabiliales bacterium]